MDADRSPSTLVIGLAFFSMFFGSGNLIFPLMLGARFESNFWLAALGFIVTAVILPTLGILAMLPTSGHYEKLFLGLLPEKIFRYFFLVILLFWIPLGSGPRCVVLAHASIKNYLAITPPLWLFSLLFLALVYLCIRSPSRIIEILGKVLTPILLASILLIVITSFRRGVINEAEIEVDQLGIFLDGLTEGYYTQDLIAALFFSSTLVLMLKPLISDRREALIRAFKGGMMAVLLLAIVYTALMAASAVHAEHLNGLSGEVLISTLAHIALGQTLGGISSVAVFLACFTTEVALMLVFADFLNNHLLHGQKRNQAMILSLLVVWMMSLFNFGGIMAIIGPAMKILYPLLFLLVMRLLWRSRKQMLP